MDTVAGKGAQDYHPRWPGIRTTTRVGGAPPSRTSPLAHLLIAPSLSSVALPSHRRRRRRKLPSSASASRLSAPPSRSPSSRGRPRLSRASGSFSLSCCSGRVPQIARNDHRARIAASTRFAAEEEREGAITVSSLLVATIRVQPITRKWSGVRTKAITTFSPLGERLCGRHTMPHVVGRFHAPCVCRMPCATN